MAKRHSKAVRAKISASMRKLHASRRGGKPKVRKMEIASIVQMALSQIGLAEIHILAHCGLTGHSSHKGHIGDAIARLCTAKNHLALVVGATK